MTVMRIVNNVTFFNDLHESTQLPTYINTHMFIYLLKTSSSFAVFKYTETEKQLNKTK